ncbi:MAG: RHS repeat protein, partial [Candidatus Coatesbacteria bacterium]|nr:RHS repeat protein [Candidatus Coatesbacteria bacterium]
MKDHYFYYDKYSNLVNVVDENGVTVSTIEYDEMNRPLKKTNSLGNSYQFEYSKKGDCTKRTDALGHVTNYAYDGDHRLIAIDYPTDSTVTFEYDEAGNQTKISDGADDITMEYNLSGQLTKLTNSAASKAIEYAYNEVGLPSWMRDYEGDYAYYSYDDLLRLASIVYPTGGTVGFDYATSSSLRTKITLPNGAYTDFGYDLNGQVTSAASRKSDETLLESHSYDYDAVGRLTSIEDQDANETSLAYDSVGRLTYASFPGEPSVNYYYDAAGRRTSATDADDATTTFEYDDFGQLIECVTEGVGSTSYEYDLNGN